MRVSCWLSVSHDISTIIFLLADLKVTNHHSISCSVVCWRKGEEGEEGEERRKGERRVGEEERGESTEEKEGTSESEGEKEREDSENSDSFGGDYPKNPLATCWLQIASAPSFLALEGFSEQGRNSREPIFPTVRGGDQFLLIIHQCPLKIFRGSLKILKVNLLQ